MGLKPTAT